MFKKKDLITRKAEAGAKLSMYERKYEKTNNNKYKDKIAYCKQEIDGIDICLGKTKYTNTKKQTNINFNNTKNSQFASNNKINNK